MASFLTIFDFYSLFSKTARTIGLNFQPLSLQRATQRVILPSAELSPTPTLFESQTAHAAMFWKISRTFLMNVCT